MIESEPRFIVLLDMAHCSPGTWAAGEAFRLVCGHITRYEKEIYVLSLLRAETAGPHWQPQTTIRARGGNYALTHHADLFRDAAAVIAEKRGFSIDDVMNSPRNYCFENEAILDEHFDKGMTYGDVMNEDKSIYKTAGSEAEELHGVSLKEELEALRKFHSEMVLGIYAFLEDSEVERPTTGGYPGPKSYHPDEPSAQVKMYCIAEGCDARVFIDSEDELCKFHDDEKLKTCICQGCNFPVFEPDPDTEGFCRRHNIDCVHEKISKVLGRNWQGGADWSVDSWELTPEQAKRLCKNNSLYPDFAKHVAGHEVDYWLQMIEPGNYEDTMYGPWDKRAEGREVFCVVRRTIDPEGESTTVSLGGTDSWIDYTFGEIMLFLDCLSDAEVIATHRRELADSQRWVKRYQDEARELRQLRETHQNMKLAILAQIEDEEHAELEEARELANDPEFGKRGI